MNPRARAHALLVWYDARMPSRSPFAPLAIWLLPQIAVLALMAGQVPIIAPKAMPTPVEVMALRFMLVVQITLGALLFPFLLRDVRSASLVISSSIPMTLLAAFLAGEITRWKMAYAILYVVTWMTGLALWRVALRTPRSQAIGVAIALLVVFGGVAFWYVRAEYALQSDAFDLQHSETWTPIFGAFAAASFESLTPAGWLLLLAAPVSGALAASTKLLHTTPHFLS